MLLLACAGALACGKGQSPCKPGDWKVENGFPQTLDQVCMVARENDAIVPLAGVTTFDLNTPLFSDGAVKLRTVWMPPGAAAQYDANNAFTFPDGTVFTKSFGFRDDDRKATPVVRWVETRVIARQHAGYIAVSYVWNDAGTQATVSYGGSVVPVSWLDDAGAPQSTNYLVPDGNQCKQCHNINGVTTPIGPKARNLNKDFAYDGGTANQLDHWSADGMLTGAPASSAAPKLAAWNDPATGTVSDRARAYLEVNCAHCHSEGGAARTTGLYLWHDETDPSHDGFCKMPVAAGEGTGGFDYDIVPGDPAHSILTFRMNATTPGIAMPQIGRSIVDTEGVALVTQWIAGLDGGCAP